jgi:hypothetical protein
VNEKGGAKVLDLVNQPLSFLIIQTSRVIMNAAINEPQEKRVLKNSNRKLKRNTAIAFYVVSLLIILVGLRTTFWVSLLIQPVSVLSLYYVYAFRSRKIYQINSFPIVYAVGISLHILLSLLLFVWLVTSSV